MSKKIKFGSKRPSVQLSRKYNRKDIDFVCEYFLFEPKANNKECILDELIQKFGIKQVESVFKEYLKERWRN